jgi:hypothetical protein
MRGETFFWPLKPLSRSCLKGASTRSNATATKKTRIVVNTIAADAKDDALASVYDAELAFEAKMAAISTSEKNHGRCRRHRNGASVP